MKIKESELRKLHFSTTLPESTCTRHDSNSDIGEKIAYNKIQIHYSIDIFNLTTNSLAQLNIYLQFSKVLYSVYYIYLYR